MHYYKFNIPDWVLHTSHLTPQEEGIYLRIINHYYDSEGPIPEKTQPVIRRLRLTPFEENVTAILNEYFELKDGFWLHKRCEKEVLAYQAKAITNKANGCKGGRPRGSGYSKSKKDKPEITQLVNSENPETTLTSNHKPSTKNQTPSKSPDGDHRRFDEFYSAYPRKAARAQALKAWNKLKPDDTLINRLLEDIPRRIATGEFDINDKAHIPHPATYLNGQRWEDEITARGVPHETCQQPGGGRKLSAVDRIQRHSDTLEQQISIAEADEALASFVGPPGGDLWPPADQSVRGDNAGDLEAPAKGVLVKRFETRPGRASQT